MNRLLRVLATLLALAGLTQCLAAGWIHGKAWLAQSLIERSFDAAGSSSDARPWPWADTQAVARMRWSGQRDLYVLSGANARHLAFGPVLHEDPGKLGARMVSGHRDTHFAALDSLQPGMHLEWQDADGETQTYVVRESFTIDLRRERLRVPDSAAFGADDILMLSTCWPLRGAAPNPPHRLIVVAEKLGDWTGSARI